MSILDESGAGVYDEAAAQVYDESFQPFPAGPLDLRCELLLGSAYTDVSQYVYQRDGSQPPVVLTRGRADESATANPGSATWQWNNRDGRFSPLNPVSPYYGQLGRNTPVRWSVPSQTAYMRIETDTASYAQCPDAAPLDITGDIDIRLDLKPSDCRPAALAGKNAGGTGPSWLLERHGDGLLVFFWWDSGGSLKAVVSSAPVPYGRVAIRVTLTVATGTVTFYTAPSVSGAWTQLGAAQSATGGAATTVFSGTAPLRAGDNSSASYGSYYAFELRNGIGGTVVANPDFTAQAPGSTSFTDAAGNTWTLAGTAEISGRDYRFHGEMSSQPPKWDVTGADQYVAAAAGGPLRRLTQGQAPPVLSPVQRGYLQLPASEMLVAYWPGEDAAGASSLGSAVGGPAMYFSGPLQLASGSSFIASSPLPVMNGAVLAGTVPPYAGGTACVFRFLLSEAAGSIPNGTVIARMATTGTVAWADLSYDSGGGLTLTGYSPSGSVLFTLGPIAFGLDGGNWLLEMVLGASGANLAYAVNGMTPGAATQVGLSGMLSSAVPGNVTRVYAAPLGGVNQVTMGHFAVQAHYDSTQLQAFSQPLNAWQGEAAANRYARLAGENGYAARILGAPGTSAAMGAQAIDTLANLLQAVEKADGGQQFEARQQLALGYRTLASLYNQSPAVSADYSQAQAGGVNGGGGDSGLDPVYDDQLTRNDWTLTRSAGSGASGSTFRAQLGDGSAMSTSPPPAGAGDYGDSETVNVATDDQLQDLAWWRVHVGTVDQARWPVIPWNLARAAVQNAGLYYPLLDADVGDFVQLSNLPGIITYDPVRQLVYGTKESLGGLHHTVEWNCVPELPYEVAADGLGYHVDTDGSVLQAAVSASAVQLAVSTANPSSPPWTTAAADFPFDTGAAGERMTATNIDGPPANFLTLSGTFDAGLQNWAPTGGNSAVAPVTSPVHSGTGAMSVTATAAGVAAAQHCSAAQATADGLPCSPGDMISVAAWFRAAAAANPCQVGVNFKTSAGGAIAVLLASPAVTDTAGDWVKVAGTVTAPATAAFAIGYAQVTATGAGEVHYVDDAYISGPGYPAGAGDQTLTVTRSVNGVVKSHAAGTPVTLWQTPIAAL